MTSFNLAIQRKHSLAGIGEGWGENCYILVSAASTAQVREWQSLGVDDMDDARAMSRLIEILAPQILGGKVLSTKDDGSQELVEFRSDQATEVLDALPVTILRAVMETCVGLDLTATQ